MSGPNRGRLSVQPDGKWRLYTNLVPAGWRALGTITRDGETGALVESPAGILCQLNAGAIRSLDQRKARAALEAARGIA